MFQDDLGNATEIVLRRWARVRPAGDVRVPRVRGGGGSATRAAAGALRIGNALGSVLAARRVHGPAERWLMAEGGLLLAVLAGVGFVWPRLLAWPLAAFSLWLGLALLARAARRKAATPSPRPHRRQPPPSGSRSLEGLMRFRVLTYNIHRAIGVDRRFRPERIIRILESHDADIVLLQEVDDGAPRSRELDLARELATALGYAHLAVGHNVTLRKGRYGNATLSRHPILRERNIDLTIGRWKRRGCQHTAIALEGQPAAGDSRSSTCTWASRPGSASGRWRFSPGPASWRPWPPTWPAWWAATSTTGARGFRPCSPNG